MEDNYKSKNPSPCLSCTRVKEPENCENKNCQGWRAWFLDRWARIHAFYLQQTKIAETKPIAANAEDKTCDLPQQVEACKGNNPCESCLCKEMCAAPCLLRKAWEGGTL